MNKKCILLILIFLFGFSTLPAEVLLWEKSHNFFGYVNHLKFKLTTGSFKAPNGTIWISRNTGTQLVVDLNNQLSDPPRYGYVLYFGDDAEGNFIGTHSPNALNHSNEIIPIDKLNNAVAWTPILIVVADWIGGGSESPSMSESLHSNSVSTLYLDDTPPSISLPPPTMTLGAGAVLGQGSFSDSQSGLQTGYFSLNGSFPSDSVVIPEGSNQVYVFAMDNVGNTAQVTRTIVSDHGGPQISLPPSGSFRNVNLSTISASDGNGVVAKTFYVNNVQVPPWYTFPSDGLYEVRVVAVDGLGSTSTAVRGYRIDNVPPAIIGSFPANNSVLKSRTFNAAADVVSDISPLRSCLMYLNGNLTAFPFTVNPGQNQTLRVVATDVPGNVLDITRTFSVDDTAPTIVASFPLNNALIQPRTLQNASEVATDLNGINSFQIYVNGSARVPAFPFVLSEGMGQLVRIVATDPAGNTLDVSRTINVDGTVPNVLASFPANNAIIFPTTFQNISAVVADANGIQSCLIYLDGSTNPAAFPFTISAGPSRTVRIVATDNAGNVLDTTRTYTVDASNPAISPYGGIGTTTTIPTSIKSNVPINFRATDAGGSTIDNSSWSLIVTPPNLASHVSGVWDGTAGNYVVKFLATAIDGLYTIQLQVSDNVGNLGQSSDYSINVDNTAPTFTLNIPAYAGVNATVSISNVSSGGTGGSPIAAYSYTLGTSSPESLGLGSSEFTVGGTGTQPISFTVTDAAGNSTTHTGSITFDTVAPAVTLGDIVVSGTNRTVVVSATDVGSGFDSAVPTNIARSATIVAGNTNVAIGLSSMPVFGTQSAGAVAFSIPVNLTGNAVEVTARVSDRAGNQGVVTRTFDLAGPSVSFNASDAIENGTWYRNTPLTETALRFAISATDLGNVNDSSIYFVVRRAGHTDVTVSGTTTYAVPGLSTVTAYVSDSAGNQSSASIPLVYDAIITDWTLADSGTTSAAYIKPTDTATLDITLPTEANASLTAASRLVIAKPSGITVTPSLISSNTVARFDAGPAAEGTYALGLQHRDLAGNLSNTIAWTVNVDGQAPTLAEIRAFNGTPEVSTATPLGPLDFLTDNSTRIQVFAADNFLLAGYSYQIVNNTSGIAPSIWPSTWTAGSQYLDFTGLSSGETTYFYVRIKDAAGNISSVYERSITVNDQNPAPPSIVSTTHARASLATDAAPWSTAVFTLGAPYTGPAGLKEFKWRLLKGTSKDNAIANVSLQSGTLLEGPLQLSALPDNQIGEFYYLAASVVAGNDKTSSEAFFAFRVDTTPPNGLVVRSSTHPLPDLYYNSQPLVFEWNQPADFSGVRRYGYKLYPNASSAPTTEPTSQNGFVETDSRYVSTALTGTEGTFGIWVYAEDFAGNLKWDWTQAQYDTAKPAFAASLETAVQVVPNLVGRSVDIAWDVPTDNVSDANSITVGLKLQRLSNSQTIDVTRWVYVQTKSDGTIARSVHWEGLTNASTYIVRIQLSDQAGNVSVLAPLFFQLDGTPVANVVIQEEFVEQVAGFSVAGIETFTNGVRTDGTAWMEISAPDFLKPMVAPFDTLGFASFNRQDRSWSTGQSNLGWAWNDIQRTATGTGLVLNSSATGGLVLKGFSTLVPIVPAANPLAGQTTSLVSFGDVNVGPAPYFYWQSSRTVLPGHHRINTFSGDGAQTQPAWQLESISNVQLSGTGWNVVDGAIWETSGLAFSATIGSGPGSQSKLHLGLAHFEGSKLTRAPVTDPVFNLVAGGVRYLVGTPQLVNGSAELLENTLLVHRAVVQIQQPDSSYRNIAQLKDFSVDRDGKVSETVSYSYTILDSAIPTPYGTLTITEIRLKNGVLLIGEGTIARADGTVIAISDFGLDVNGLTSGTVTGDFEKVYFGYRVRAKNGTVVNGVRTFSTATIDMPAFGLSDYTISNLGISVANDDILVAGTSSAVTTIKSPYGDSGTWISALLLGSAGLSADLAIDLPASWGAGRLSGGHFNLQSTGTITSLVPATTSLDITVAAYPVHITGFTFALDGAVLTSIGADLSSAFSAPRYTFADLVLKSDGTVVSPGRGTQAINFSAGVWNFAFETLSWSGNGPEGIPAVSMPTSLGGERLKLGTTTVKPDGTFIMVDGVTTLELTIHDWFVTASRARLVGDDIVISNVSIVLPGIMDGNDIQVGSVTMRHDGTLVSSNSSEVSNFRATNGFRVRGTDVKFTDSGIRMGGTVYFPESLGGAGIVFPADSLELATDGAIITPDLASTTSPNQTAQIAGFDVSVTSLWFDRKGLTVASASVIPLGLIPIQLPQFVLYPTGEFKIDGVSIAGFDLPISDGVSAGVKSLRFSETGLSMDAFLTLPPDWGANAIYFEELTIHSNGTITSNSRIPHFEFTAEDIGLNVSLDDIAMTPDGFSIANGKFSITKGELSGKSFGFSNFLIKTDGSISVDNIESDPLELFGYKAHLTSFALNTTGRTIGFGGSIQLAEDFPVEQLAGKVIDIQSFVIGFDGNLKELKVRLDGELRFPIYDNWFITVQSIEIDRALLKVAYGSLEMPPGFGIESIGVTNISLNLETGAFSIGEVALNNVKFNVEGVDFLLTKLSISPERGLLLSGSVTIPAQSPAGVDYPEVLRNKSLIVRTLQVKPDFTIGEIDATLAGLSGPLLSENLILSNGSLGISSVGGSIDFSVGGKVTLGPEFPPGLAGKAVDIRAFTVSLNSGEIKALDIALDMAGSPLSVDLFNTAKINISRIGIAKAQTAGDFEIQVAGEFVLGSEFPDILKDKKVVVSDFRINQNGVVLALTANFSLGVREKLFDDVYLRDAGLAVRIDQIGPGLREMVFTAAGKVEFGPNFPVGIAGLIVGIDKMEWTGSGVVKAIQVGIQLPENLNLFETVAIRGGRLAFSQNAGDSAPLISVQGSIILPSTLPKGLAGLSINITKFSIRTNGNLDVLDVGFSGLSVNLFDVVNLVDSGMQISNDTNDRNRLIFRIFGGLQLPSTMPGSLSGLRVNIQDFSFDNRGTVMSFAAQLGSVVRIDLFEGFKIAITRLNVNNTGISVGAQLEIPGSSFLGSGGTFGVREMTILWSGQIASLDVLIGAMSIDIAGFKIAAEGLSVGTSGVRLAKATMTVPLEAIGTKQIELYDASFDSHGTFSGRIGVDQIAINLSGFELQFVRPSFDFAKKALAFEIARVKAPEFLANFEAKLENAIINSQGLDFQRASFGMGPITISPALTMRRLGMTLTKNGGSYDVGGDIKVVISGASSVEVNGEILYGDGRLKRLFFSFYSSQGIPLGTTPLFLNGLRGGFNTGAPTEVPLPYRNLFESDGFRLQLGATISVVRPELCRIDGDLFIDVYNGSFAAVGKVELFAGVVKGEAGFGVSFVRKIVFLHASVDMLSIVSGTADLYIFDYQGRVLINGQASVAVRLKMGAIAVFPFDFVGWEGGAMWPFGDGRFVWKTYYIYVLPFDLDIASGSAEFGTFRNGMVGVRAELRALNIVNVKAMVETNGGFTLDAPDTHIITPPGF